MSHLLPVRVIRLLFLWIYSTLFWIPLATVHLLTFRKLIPDLMLTQLIHFWGRSSLTLLGIQYESSHAARVAKSAPRVMVTNHQSGLDVLWGAAFCPSRVLVIGKKEVLFVPILNLIWLALGFIFVDRGNTQKAVKSLGGVAQKIKSDLRTLVIAPEGTRTPNGKLGTFKKGGFHIAVEGQIPLYPVVVQGAYELLSKDEWIPKPGKLKVTFLEPIQTAGKKAEDIPQLMELTQHVMSQQLKS